MSVLQKSEIITMLQSQKEKYATDGFIIEGLFGSYSSGEATENSDIDILYDIENNFLDKYKGFVCVSKIIEIQDELSKIFHKKVELTSSSGLSKRIKENILSETIYV